MQVFTVGCNIRDDHCSNIALHICQRVSSRIPQVDYYYMYSFIISSRISKISIYLNLKIPLALTSTNIWTFQGINLRLTLNISSRIQPGLFCKDTFTKFCSSSMNSTKESGICSIDCVACPYGEER